jgi:Ca-activated chloride channel family protein
MSFLGFSSWTNAWLFALLAPLVIFYFLKLRRPQREIPSLALWRQVINDQRVNSPFQKFKRNLLLLFQILLLSSLALAAMQPFRPSGAKSARYQPILIDCSASMAALDVPDGQSRLEDAKREIRKLIDNLLPDQRIALIAVHSSARRLTDFTDNKRVLHEALDRLAVSQVPSRLEDGLRMAQALSRTVRIESVLLFSDGNVPDQIEFELPFQLNYQRLKPGGTNVGITDFNARRTQTGWDVFARLEASEKTKGSVDVDLRQDGQSIGHETVVIEGGKAERLVFRVNAAQAVSLELTITPDGFDSLSADNTAYLDLPEPRPLAVYCPAEMKSYRHALRALKEIELHPGEAGATPANVDLRFTDQAEPAGPEGMVTVHVGVIPGDLQSLVDVETGLVEVVDWSRTAPLLQHVQLFDVQIADNPKSREGVSERDYELAGYEILAQGRNGPLILEKTGDGKLDYFLLFHTDRSSLPYRVGFPILISNAVQIALQSSALSEARALPTGVLPPLRGEPESSYSVSGPDRVTETIVSDKQGILSGVPAPVIGRYTVAHSGDTVGSFGVSLMSSGETQLTSVGKLQFPEVSVGSDAPMVKSDTPLWGWLAIAGLILLLVEWWYFQRRPGGVPA